MMSSQKHKQQFSEEPVPKTGILKIVLCKNGFISCRKFILSEGTDKTEKRRFQQNVFHALASTGSTPENYRSKGGFDSRMQYEKAS